MMEGAGGVLGRYTGVIHCDRTAMPGKIAGPVQAESFSNKEKPIWATREKET